MEFADLSRIARKVVSKVVPDLRDDTYQEIWLKFLRWPPPTRSYAWRAATSARNSLWRKEKAWWRLRDEGPESLNGECLSSMRLARLNSSLARSLPPEERKRRDQASHHRSYYVDLNHSRALVRERVRRHRARRKAVNVG